MLRPTPHAPVHRLPHCAYSSTADLVRACRFRGGPLKRGEVLHGIYGGTKSTHAGSYDAYECRYMHCAQIALWVCAWVSLQDGMS